MDTIQALWKSLNDFLDEIIIPVGEKIDPTETEFLSLKDVIFLLITILVIVFVTRQLRKLIETYCSNFIYRINENRQKKDKNNTPVDNELANIIAIFLTYPFAALFLLLTFDQAGFNIAYLGTILAALSVGIGIGLQNIISNFFSGIILRFEEKIKKDDFIEFNDIKGYVTKFSTRSTIIRTRDGAEVLVPNRQLFESIIINWRGDGKPQLESAKTHLGRIHIPFDVVNGSDPALVTESVVKAANLEANVLRNDSTKTPKVVFVGFGENALRFELWVWTDRMDKEPEIKSSLYYLIEYYLRQYNIPHPTPQLELEVVEPNRYREIPALPPSIRDQLKQVPLFSNLSDFKIRELIELGYRAELKASDILFHQYEVGDSFYIVLSGCIEIIKEKKEDKVDNKNKKTTIIRTYRTIKTVANKQPGDYFGEVALLFPVTRTAGAQAAEDTILFSLD